MLKNAEIILIQSLYNNKRSKTSFEMIILDKKASKNVMHVKYNFIKIFFKFNQ